MERDYAPQGVKFFYIYKALAHPETNGYITPFTLEERLMHVKEAERTLGSRIPWICDTMDNDLKHALGNAPNSEFIIDPQGKVVRKRVWSRPSELRQDLEDLVGPVDNPTQVADLDIKQPPPRQRAAKGVVERVRTPGAMRPLKVEPLVNETDAPFYVKLRVEAETGLMRDGQGKMYLGFFLDPLYEVHWNNKAQPLRFELTPPEGVTATPTKAAGPNVEEPADSDPREFLVDVQAEQSSGPLQLTVHYFACDDAETFCVPVTQKYVVHLEQDPDGGSRRSPRGGGGRRPDLAGAPGALLQRILENDQDGDGKVSRDDLPEPMRNLFARLDANDDGFVDRSEVEHMRRRFGSPDRRPGSAFGRPSGGGPIPGNRLLRALDLDGDRTLSAAEIAQAVDSLKRLDLNDDGDISVHELTWPASRQSASSETRDVDPQTRYQRYAAGLLKKYDGNRDGELSADEWSQMSRSPEEADADGNGRITVEELLTWLQNR